MDAKTIITMFMGIVARGLGFALTTWLGFESAKASELSGQITAGLGAIIVAAITIWSAYSSRKKLLYTPAPADKK